VSRWAAVGEIAVVFLVPAGILIFATPLAGEDPLRSQVVAWIVNVSAMALIWLGLRLRGEGWSDLGLFLTRPKPATLVRTVGVSVVVFVVALMAFVVGAIVAANLFGMPEPADPDVYAYMRGNLPMLLGALAAAYLASSIGEEVIYRGFLINRIASLSGQRHRWKVAVVASAIVFGLAHYSWGPAGMVQTGFMGLALGAAYLRVGRRLWVTILAHAYLDTILFVQMYLNG
jgi:hypothetical protein